MNTVFSWRLHGFFALLLWVAISPGLQAGPAPYSSAKLYILTDPGSYSPHDRTPEFIRKEADIIVELKVFAVVPWFASLNWENARHDPDIKRKAGPLVMIIDLYDRVQPDASKKPEFDVLYCTEKYAYSDEGDYIPISKVPLWGIKFP